MGADCVRHDGPHALGVIIMLRWVRKYPRTLTEWRIRLMIRDQTSALIEAQLETIRAIAKERWANIRNRFRLYGKEVHDQSKRMNRLEQRIGKPELEAVRWPGGINQRWRKEECQD